MQDQVQNSTSAENSSKPELSSPSHTDVETWRHALIPWKEGGKPYTYLVPPGVEIGAGWWAMVVKPNGTPSVFQVSEIQPHSPTTFALKPIANCWTDEQWQEMVQAAHPEKPTISMHADFAEWVVQAADMFVEGR